MGVEYYGPISLKATVEKVYEEIAHLYVRTDPVLQTGKLYNVTGNFIDSTIIEPDREWIKSFDLAMSYLIRKTQKFSTGMKHFSRIKMYCATGNYCPKGLAAFYLPSLDFISFQPRVVFHRWSYSFFERRGFYQPNLEIVKNFDFACKHELVHWDLADTKPEIRLKDLKRTCENPNENWVSHMVSGDSVKLPKLNDDEKKVLDKLKKEGKKNPKLDYILAAERINWELGFAYINEGFAYAVNPGDPPFREYANDSYDLDAFRKAYDYIRNRLRDKNQRDLMLEIKDAINTCFDNNESIFKILGIH